MAGFQTLHLGAKDTTPGMGRFFSPMNLDRYRKLASGAIGEAEQHQLLKDLAEEMIEFRREARLPGITPSPAFSTNAASQSDDRSEHTIPLRK